MDLWIDLAEEPDSLLIFPLIEMAKFLNTGRRITSGHWHVLRGHSIGRQVKQKLFKHEEELLHRRRRLRRKLKAISGAYNAPELFMV